MLCAEICIHLQYDIYATNFKSVVWLDLKVRKLLELFRKFQKLPELFKCYFTTTTMNDAANSRAHFRSKLGLTRELQQERTDLLPEPSSGGTRGFPIWFRQRVIAHATSHRNEAAAAAHGYSTKSIRRWHVRLEPHRMTSSKERKKLTGNDQLLLAIGLFVSADSTSNELCLFLVRVRKKMTLATPMI